MTEISKFEVQGTKGVLVKLEPYKGETVTRGGLIVPKYKNYETDGGRPASKRDPERFSTVGQIVAISDKAQELMDQEMMNYKVGDTIAVYSHVKNSNNWFIEDKLHPVADWNGYLLVHPNSLECKLINDDNE